MTLLRLVQSSQELEDSLPHPPGTYDHTTYEGMEKDDENGDFCREAFEAIVDYKGRQPFLLGGEHDRAAELYLRAWGFYIDRCGETIGRLKAIHDAEELKREVSTFFQAHFGHAGWTTTTKRTSAPQTSKNNAVADKTQESKRPDTSTTGIDNITSTKMWSFVKETADDLKMDGFSWAKIAFLKSLNPAHDYHSTLSKRKGKQEKQTKSAATAQAASSSRLVKLPPPRRKKSLEPV